MPKLIYFVACEKVLIAEEEKLVSLIGLLDSINTPKPSADRPDVQAGMSWCIVSFWTQQPDDEGKAFQQRTKVVSPNGQSGAEAIIDFEIKGRSHRNTVKVFGFPIAQTGEHNVVLSIRETGKEEWVDIGAYPIKVEHIEAR